MTLNNEVGSCLLYNHPSSVLCLFISTSCALSTFILFVQCIRYMYFCACGGFLRLLLISVYYSFVVSVYIVLSICQVFALPFCCFLFGII